MSCPDCNSKKFRLKSLQLLETLLLTILECPKKHLYIEMQLVTLEEK